MTIKAILALADGGAGTEATLRTAVMAAGNFDAHLEVLHVRADAETMVPIVGEGMSGAMVEQVMDSMVKSIETRATRARASYERICAGGTISADWREAAGREPEVVAAAGRLADVIVLGRPDSAEEAPMAATIDAALFDTGRPVLVAPSTAPDRLGERVAVAWNGSAQSSRAIALSHPRVQSLHDLRTRTAGPNVFIQLHLEMDGQMSLFAAHEIADQVEAKLSQAFPGAEVIIHQDPAGLHEQAPMVG